MEGKGRYGTPTFYPKATPTCTWQRAGTGSQVIGSPFTHGLGWVKSFVCSECCEWDPVPGRARHQFILQQLVLLYIHTCFIHDFTAKNSNNVGSMCNMSGQCAEWRHVCIYCELLPLFCYSLREPLLFKSYVKNMKSNQWPWPDIVTIFSQLFSVSQNCEIMYCS